jgi:hypothetical protein
MGQRFAHNSVTVADFQISLKSKSRKNVICQMTLDPGLHDNSEPAFLSSGCQRAHCEVVRLSDMTSYNPLRRRVSENQLRSFQGEDNPLLTLLFLRIIGSVAKSGADSLGLAYSVFDRNRLQNLLCHYSVPFFCIVTRKPEMKQVQWIVERQEVLMDVDNE